MADNDIKMVCKSCGKATTGIIKEIEYTIREGRALSCMHCKAKLKYPYNGVKDCMRERCYKRDKGAIKQTRE